uniref:Uncharacterized protein n=1 Tax=Ditylenchus dipsaci TaxID=166011 RepID=A0A915DC40_9BILA
MIVKSFKDCGITNLNNADEDDQIHCFKEKGPVPEGLQMLKEARFAAEDLPLIDVVDSDEDEENVYASDHSLNEKK